MATPKPSTLAIALVVAAASHMLAVPAGAQFSGARSAFEERPHAELVQLRDFFQFFGDRPAGQANPYNPLNPARPPQAFESVRAPLPRKVETPPSRTVLVIGDSLADWLGYGLEQAFTDTPDVGIVRKIKFYSGLVRYEAARADMPDWSQAVKDLLAPEKPSAIVIMLGVNDRLPLRERAPPAKGVPPVKGAAPSPPEQGTTPATQAPPDAAKQSDGEQQPAIAAPEPQRRAGPGGNYEFHTDQWAELYGKRIDEMIAALKSKGVPVLWVGLPAVRGARSTTDMSYLDELYRARAEKAGITYVDVWDGFVDDKGQFAVQGPDFEGQIRRLRTFDGINFTKPGAEKLARYVERELRRVMNSPVIPVALPGPEEQSKGSAVGARPAVGPIVPLSATASGEGSDLLGAPSHPAPANSDPIASRVLSHGDAIAAPPGRADDFSWPRADANAAPDTMPAPVISAPPVAPPAKGASKGDANKAEVKKPAAPNVAPRRPPLSIDPAASNAR